MRVVSQKRMMKMEKLFNLLDGAHSIGIAGHVRPDGDCIGSCMALYNYISDVFPRMQVDVYLEMVPNVFGYINNIDKVKTTIEGNENKIYDVFVSLDCGDVERLGLAGQLFSAAKKKINIDHHISNTSFGDVNVVLAHASSTCETLFNLMEEDSISKAVAEALYTGIVHDTGVFKHSNTSGETMRIAGRLIEKGVEFSKIIDESFYQKTYMQNQLLGRCLTESVMALNNTCIISVLTENIMKFYGANSKDIDGIIDQLRVTKGVEVAILIHEVGLQTFKVSMRSNHQVDVSQIAVSYGGGGHVRAAGCTMMGTENDVIDNIIRLIDLQLREQSK